MRLARNSKSYEFIHDWVKEGAKDDPAAPAALALEILPGSRVLNAPAASQQLVVRLRLEGGATRDVTPICYYDSSSPDIAEVDSSGYVRFKNRGEAAIIAHYLNLVATIRLTHLVDVPGFKVAQVPQDNVIDRTVFAKLNRMRISPSEVCTDQEFIRRVYLDTIGILPTPQEVQDFLSSKTADRRGQVIDRLLNRPEFVDFWTLKFADILRSNGRLIQPKGAYRLPPLDSLGYRARDAHGRVRPRAADHRRLDLHASGRQLLSDQPRPGELGRNDRPALPGCPHPVRQVPQPSVRALDPGRLLRLRRLLLAGRPQEGEPAG